MTSIPTVSLKPLAPGESLTPLHFAAVRADGLAFLDCVRHAIATPDLVKEFDRLRGTDLSGRASPIAQMIDQATGKADHDVRLFLEFIWDVIFCRA